MPKSFKQSYAETRQKTQARIQDFMSRRPHRSFRVTRRRDYRRSLKLPGYIAFTHHVNTTVWRFRKIFLALAIVYGLLTGVLVGIGSQETYSTLTDTLQETGSEVFEGNWGQLGQAGLLFASIATSGLTGTPSEAQQIYATLLVLLVWLTTVWLLRNLLAGHKVRMRDGLYSAGAPVVPLFIISLLLVIQLLPLGLALIAYSAASASGLLEGGVEAMLFWAAAGLLAILSLYWIVSTFMAMIVVTLPGMYPGRALRTAGDMVVGRRVRILLRLLWMVLVIALAWAVVLIPFILLDAGVKNLWPAIEWLPVIPVVLLLLGILSVVWSSAYVYLLYRRVVDDDAKPA
jgi:hypothetical protein